MIYRNNNGELEPIAGDPLLRCPFPIGATYTQYPNTPTPEELWFGTTWTALDFGGLIFKSSVEFKTVEIVNIIDDFIIEVDDTDNITPEDTILFIDGRIYTVLQVHDGNILYIKENVSDLEEGGVLFIGQNDHNKSHTHEADIEITSAGNHSHTGTAGTTGSTHTHTIDITGGGSTDYSFDINTYVNNGTNVTVTQLTTIGGIGTTASTGNVGSGAKISWTTAGVSTTVSSTGSGHTHDVTLQDNGEHTHDVEASFSTEGGEHAAVRSLDAIVWRRVQ